MKYLGKDQLQKLNVLNINQECQNNSKQDMSGPTALLWEIYSRLKLKQSRCWCEVVTCGVGKTSLERFLVNSATPLVCRMADGRSLSFFFLIFCLSFFLSLSSCSLPTKKTVLVRRPWVHWVCVNVFTLCVSSWHTISRAHCFCLHFNSVFVFMC